MNLLSRVITNKQFKCTIKLLKSIPITKIHILARVKYKFKFKGVALEKIGNFEEAILVYDLCLKLNPNFAYAYINKGWAN